MIDRVEGSTEVKTWLMGEGSGLSNGQPSFNFH